MWGGISRKGPGPLVIFKGIMDSTFYQGLLRDHFMPYVQHAFPQGYRLMQDNDPKHVSKSTKAFMEDNNISWWPTPPESPDLNPIENLWHALKYHLRVHVKPSTQEELITGITQYWQNLTAGQCNRYINHLYRVMPAVVTCWGAASGY